MEVDAMKLFRKAQKGFTLVEIMIVVAIIGILIAIAVPGFVKARTQSRLKSCQENLTKIDGAKEQWALENNKTTGAAVVWTNIWAADGTLYLKTQAIPICPTGVAYTINVIGTAPTCADATHVMP
jgi:prepilin-type N-terminal cleavage/methylation domain-containing protein